MLFISFLLNKFPEFDGATCFTNEIFTLAAVRKVCHGKLRANYKMDRNGHRVAMFACDRCDNMTSPSGLTINMARIVFGKSVKNKHPICGGPCGRLLLIDEPIVHGAIGLPTENVSICINCFNEGGIAGAMKPGKLDPNTDVHEMSSREFFKAKFRKERGCVYCLKDIAIGDAVFPPGLHKEGAFDGSKMVWPHYKCWRKDVTGKYREHLRSIVYRLKGQRIAKETAEARAHAHALEKLQSQTG
jgi:hypothetical protein